MLWSGIHIIIVCVRFDGENCLATGHAIRCCYVRVVLTVVVADHFATGVGRDHLGCGVLDHILTANQSAAGVSLVQEIQIKPKEISDKSIL